MRDLEYCRTLVSDARANVGRAHALATALRANHQAIAALSVAEIELEVALRRLVWYPEEGE